MLVFVMANMTDALEELAKKAEERGLWIWCRYQDLWFSPTELREHWKADRFRWGPSNWELKNPDLHIVELQQKIRACEDELRNFRARLG